MCYWRGVKEIAPERMKRLSQCKNNTQLWMRLMMGKTEGRRKRG